MMDRPERWTLDACDFLGQLSDLETSWPEPSWREASIIGSRNGSTHEVPARFEWLA